jgi:hypothetical protein
MARSGRHLPAKSVHAKEYFALNDLPDPAWKIHGSQVTRRGLVDPIRKPLKLERLGG